MSTLGSGPGTCQRCLVELAIGSAKPLATIRPRFFRLPFFVCPGSTLPVLRFVCPGSTVLVMRTAWSRRGRCLSVDRAEGRRISPWVRVGIGPRVSTLGSGPGTCQRCLVELAVGSTKPAWDSPTRLCRLPFFVCPGSMVRVSRFYGRSSCVPGCSLRSFFVCPRLRHAAAGAGRRRMTMCPGQVLVSQGRVCIYRRPRV